MSFNHSSRVSIRGKNTFNYVHGHQFNGPIHGKVVFSAGQQGIKYTEYDEFEYVKRGHIVSTKEIHSEDVSEWDWELQNGKLFCRRKSSAKRTIYIVELIDRQSKFTAMIYEGEGAHHAWEDDFRQFSHIKNSGSFRLFGINRSAIPVLIFHHELIPLAHIFMGSFWMDIYIEHLSLFQSNIGCFRASLWMNTTSGALCRGPEGPYFSLHANAIDSIIVPRTADMLKDNTFLHFFSKFGSSADNSVLACAQVRYSIIFLDDLFPVATDHETEDPNHPVRIPAMHSYVRRLWRDPPHHLLMNDIGGLRFDTVYSPSRGAVARRPQRAGSLWRPWESDKRALLDETVLDGRLTRLKFDLTCGREVHLRGYYQWKFMVEWLSQSCRVFDALDVTEGEESFFIIRPPTLNILSLPRLEHENLTATLDLRDGKPLVEETQPSTIYLFLRPLPMTISEFLSWLKGRPYFWSVSETGQYGMSEEECERCRLPVLTLSNEGFTRLHSWSTSTYTALRDWQQARGFDPTTSDWARELGYPKFEIIDTRKGEVIDIQEEMKAGCS